MSPHGELSSNAHRSWLVWYFVSCFITKFNIVSMEGMTSGVRIEYGTPWPVVLIKYSTPWPGYQLSTLVRYDTLYGTQWSGHHLMTWDSADSAGWVWPYDEIVILWCAMIEVSLDFVTYVHLVNLFTLLYNWRMRYWMELTLVYIQLHEWTWQVPSCHLQQKVRIAFSWIKRSVNIRISIEFFVVNTFEDLKAIRNSRYHNKIYDLKNEKRWIWKRHSSQRFKGWVAS